MTFSNIGRVNYKQKSIEVSCLFKAFYKKEGLLKGIEEVRNKIFLAKSERIDIKAPSRNHAGVAQW
jgi:hypothetical protein